jgi:hypothetical protein
VSPLAASALLQVSFIGQGDANAAITAVAIVLGLVLALAVAGSVTGARRRTRSSARYTRMAFRREAAAHGLSRTHVEALEALVSATRLGQPMLLFTSSGLLDETLRKGIYSLRMNAQIPDAEKQRRLSVLLQVRQLIDKNSRRRGGVASTAMLGQGQELTLTFPDGSSVQSRVTHNLRRLLACEVPPEVDRNRWRKGTPLRAMLWKHGDSGYGFQTKIMAYDSIGGRPVFLLQHTRTMRRSQRRAHKRRAIGRNCFFYPVMILETGHGKSARREAVVQQSFRHLGILQDISAGGCAIASQAPLARAKLLRVDFELGNRRRIVAYGKVQRVGEPDGGRSTMHVMFTRLSSLHLNEILSFVYDYDVSPAAAVRTTVSRR